MRIRRELRNVSHFLPTRCERCFAKQSLLTARQQEIECSAAYTKIAYLELILLAGIKQR
jgi:ribosomal protein S27E